MNMKKLFRTGLALLLPLAAVLVVAYKAVNRVPSSELPQNGQVWEIFDEGGCLSCHSDDPKLPFYAEMPVAGKIVMKDIDSGYRAFDMTKFMEELKVDGDIDPVDLAKIEKVVLDDRMPMPKYYLVHWGSSLTSAKRQIVLDWARSRRIAMYDDNLPENRKAEPVRPVDTYIEYDPAKAELGFDLFHDTRLSVDNTVSCASCHDLATAGVDNHQYSHGVNDLMGGVNAPTVFNAVYNFVQFWDGRAATLAAQAAGPPLNPVEMASSSFDEIIAKLIEMIDGLDKKSTGEKKLTDQQVANLGYKTDILAYLADGQPKTATEILKGVTTFPEGMSNQRVSQLLRQLILDGKVSKDTVKGKTLFKVVEG